MLKFNCVMKDLILCVDIGNTTTVCGIFTREGLLFRNFRFRTKTDITPEELLVHLTGFFQVFGISVREVKGLSISSVVPPLEEVWESVAKKWLVKEWIKAEAESIPIKLDVKVPSEVGADRIVNAYAGWKKYGTSLIVVDFGTATTFDCISSEGVYLGGAIAPGLELSVETLFKKTAKLPRIALDPPPPSPLGKDTVSAMKSGLLYGFSSLVDGMVKLLSKEMGGNPLVIATGGLASKVAPFSSSIEKLEPNLTLEGLYFLYVEKIKKS